MQSIRRVTPDYFRTVGIPLIAGRAFRDSDTETRPWSCWSTAPWRGAPGRTKTRSASASPSTASTSLEIVGVVGDVREFGPREDAPVQVYRPMAQEPFAGNVLVRAAADPGLLIAAVRRAVLEANPESAVVKVQTLDDAGAKRLRRRAPPRGSSACSPRWRW